MNRLFQNALGKCLGKTWRAPGILLQYMVGHVE